MAGKKEVVSSAVRKAERYRTELLRRGVLLVPVIWGESSVPISEKKGFGTKKAPASLPSIGVRLQNSHCHGNIFYLCQLGLTLKVL